MRPADCNAALAASARIQADVQGPAALTVAEAARRNRTSTPMT